MLTSAQVQSSLISKPKLSFLILRHSSAPLLTAVGGEGEGAGSYLLPNLSHLGGTCFSLSCSWERRVQKLKMMFCFLAQEEVVARPIHSVNQQ